MELILELDLAIEDETALETRGRSGAAAPAINGGVQILGKKGKSEQISCLTGLRVSMAVGDGPSLRSRRGWRWSGRPWGSELTRDSSEHGGRRRSGFNVGERAVPQALGTSVKETLNRSLALF